MDGCLGRWDRGLAGIVAVVVSIWSHRGNERANSESRAVAEHATSAALGSVDTARASAMEAAKVAQIEADREHRELSPAGTVVKFEGERDRRTDHWNVFAIVETERCYRVRGDAVLKNCGVTSIAVPLVTHAHTPTRVHIEGMPDGREQPLARRIVLRAWPPNPELDDVEAWTCRCGKAAEDGDGTVGHWLAN